MADLFSGLLSNQFFSGGFILMLSGGVMALLRNAPLQAWHWLERRVTTRMDIIDADPAFEWVKLWLDEHEYTKRARELSISTRFIDDDPSGEIRILFSPAPGTHMFRYRGHLIRLERQRSQPDKTPASPWGSKPIETFRFQFFTRSQNLARQLLMDARECAQSGHDGKVRRFICSYGSWRQIGSYEPRPLETVVLPPGQIDSLVADIEWFMANRKWYVKRGVPWHRGYLLHGVAGSGKTSLVSALAGRFKLNLYLLSVVGPGMNDERLADLVSSMLPRSILLLEDIDAALPTRHKPKTKAMANVPSPAAEEDGGGVTLSGILNVLDGVLARDGMLVFMTSNHPGNIDPALIRRGRADVDLKFGHATPEQVEAMALRFHPEISSEELVCFVRQHGNGTQASMADVQGSLIDKYGVRFGGVNS